MRSSRVCQCSYPSRPATLGDGLYEAQVCGQCQFRVALMANNMTALLDSTASATTYDADREFLSFSATASRARLLQMAQKCEYKLCPTFIWEQQEWRIDNAVYPMNGARWSDTITTRQPATPIPSGAPVIIDLSGLAWPASKSR